MTLVDQVSNKMASVATGTRNTLSFSISRLLETSSKSVENPGGSVSPEESHDPLDESDEEQDEEEEEEDIKVHDSEEESSRIAADYPRHPAPSIGLDWYTLYALQQQQQHPQHPQHPQMMPSGMFPSHLMNAAYLRGSASGSGLPESYLSYLNRSLPGGGVSSGTPFSVAAPMAQMQLPPAPESLAPANQHMIAVDGINSGINSGIPNAFAALLEATVFKDRLAAG